jgi:hypothetical protein
MYVNISLSSTTYPNNATYHRCNIAVFITSLNFKATVLGSPKQEFTKYPGFIGNYNFTLNGDFLGTDTINIEARIISGHGGGAVNETINAPTEVYTIIPNAPPQLLDAKVSPTKGDLDTDFTYSVKYQDPEGDLPVNINLSVDGGSGQPLVPLDGIADSIPFGEVYGLSLKGSVIGLGMHTYSYYAYDGKFDAIGDIFTHDGPEVIEKIIPNELPSVTITYPYGGTVFGMVNITGTAFDPDPGDQIGMVEVRLDNGPWKFATGGADWYMHWDFNTVYPGTHVIYARASDGKDYSPVDFVEVTVIQLAPVRPSVEIVEIIDLNFNFKKVNGTSSPPDLSTSVDLVETRLEDGTWTTANAAGPVGDTGMRTYDEWAWFLDTTTLIPGFYTIAARAWAGGLVSDPVYVTITIEVRNNAPVINSTHPNKNTIIHEGAQVIFEINIDEPDNETVFYTWFYDGIIQSIPNDQNSYIFQSTYRSAGKYLIEVLVSDGHEDNGTVYYRWNLTVLDGLVIEDQTELGSDTLESEESQDFSVSVLDPEGGKFSYDWYVNGEPEPGVYGHDYKFVHESLTQNSTYCTITLVVENELNEQNSISWGMQIEGKQTGNGDKNGDSGEKGKGNDDETDEGNIVVGLLAVLVILSSIFLVYSVIRRKKQVPIEVEDQMRAEPPLDLVTPGQYPPQPPALPFPDPIAYPVQQPMIAQPVQPIQPLPQPQPPLEYIQPPTMPLAQPVQPLGETQPPQYSQPYRRYEPGDPEGGQY